MTSSKLHLDKWELKLNLVTREGYRPTRDSRKVREDEVDTKVWEQGFGPLLFQTVIVSALFSTFFRGFPPLILLPNLIYLGTQFPIE